MSTERRPLDLEALRDDISDQLAEHGPVQDPKDGLWMCWGCSWKAAPQEGPHGVPWNHWGAVERAYHAHVADAFMPVVETALRAAIADRLEA